MGTQRAEHCNLSSGYNQGLIQGAVLEDHCDVKNTEQQQQIKTTSNSNHEAPEYIPMGSDWLETP